LHDNAVLVVTPRREDIEPLLPPGLDPRWLEDPADALAAVSSPRLQLAIVDCLTRGRMATVLSRAFLYQRPLGRVVLLGASSSTETTHFLVTRDPRVDLLFPPFTAEGMREAVNVCLVAT
jgi:DNA-binding NtrC family response regulator